MIAAAQLASFVLINNAPGAEWISRELVLHHTAACQARSWVQAQRTAAIWRPPPVKLDFATQVAYVLD
jgi:hypothetical protein